MTQRCLTIAVAAWLLSFFNPTWAQGEAGDDWFRYDPLQLPSDSMNSPYENEDRIGDVFNATQLTLAEAQATAEAPLSYVNDSGADSELEKIPPIPNFSEIPELLVVGDGELHITVMGTWISKYLVRGFDATDDSGAWAAITHVELWDSGFFFQWIGTYPAHDRSKSLLPGNVPGPIQDLLPPGGPPSLERKINDINLFNFFYGKQDVVEGLDLRIGGGYLDFWRLDSDKADFMEVYSTIRFSKMPLSPLFEAHYGWPKDDSKEGEGWSTRFGLSHFCPLKEVSLCGLKPLGIKLSADVWYNGGELFAQSDTGWSFATFAAGMPIPLAKNMMLMPSVHYQWSIEDTLNDENELYASVTLQYNW